MLHQLWTMILNPTKQNLVSGFKACGLSPLDGNVTLKRLIGLKQHREAQKAEDLGRNIDATFVRMLKDMRGQTTKRKPRGPKVPAGRPVRLQDIAGTFSTSSVLADQLPSTSGAAADINSEDSSTSTDSENSSEDDLCGLCGHGFQTYRGKDWIQCIMCSLWICGKCNGGSKKKYFKCSNCA